jgi:HlyD family secretion protein
VLSPGLPVEVVIPQRKRTALQYLLEPLQQSIWRAFREN